MKILEKEFISLGFTFKQVVRDGNYAVYTKTKPSHRELSYEVIRIRSHNGYTIAGNYCPPSEMYPSSEKWGLDGFSPTNKKQAFEKMDWMMNEQFPPQPESPAESPAGKPRGRPKKNKI